MQTSESRRSSRLLWKLTVDDDSSREHLTLISQWPTLINRYLCVLIPAREDGEYMTAGNVEEEQSTSKILRKTLILSEDKEQRWS
jgi:hypothetical protein